MTIYAIRMRICFAEVFVSLEAEIISIEYSAFDFSSKWRIAEDYIKLKVMLPDKLTRRAKELVQQLQNELSDTENKIQAARRFYNGNVRDLNAGIQMFPGNIIASMFKFTNMDFFELEEGSEQKEPVQVKF